MLVHFDQCGPYLGLSAIADRAVVPPKDLDRSKRNKMCLEGNYFADDKHKATFNLVLKFSLAAKPYAEHLRGGGEKGR